MKLRAPKGEGSVASHEIGEFSDGLICLTGGEEGPLAHALRNNGVTGGTECVRTLCDLFGHENVYVELQAALLPRGRGAQSGGGRNRPRFAPAAARYSTVCPTPGRKSANCWTFLFAFAITARLRLPAACFR